MECVNYSSPVFTHWHSTKRSRVDYAPLVSVKLTHQKQVRNYKITVARVTVWQTAAPALFICLCVCLMNRCARFTILTSTQHNLRVCLRRCVSNQHSRYTLNSRWYKTLEVRFPFDTECSPYAIYIYTVYIAKKNRKLCQDIITTPIFMKCSYNQ